MSPLRRMRLAGAPRCFLPVCILFLTGVSMLACSSERPTPQQKELRIWHTETGPETQDALRNIASDFTADHPMITITFEAIAWSDLLVKLNAAISAGSPPALSHIQPFMGASYHRRDLLASVDDVVSEIGTSDILPAVRDLVYFDEHHYGITHAATTSLILYRRDVFERAGMPQPTTWSGLLQALSDLKGKDINGDGRPDYGLDFPGKESFFMEELFGELVASNGGHLYGNDLELSLDSQPVLETLGYLKDLTAFALPGWQGHGYLDTFASLARGDVLLIYLGFPRQIGYIERYASAEIADPAHFGVLLAPHGPSGEAGHVALDCENWVVFKGTGMEGEAKEFLRFLYRPKNHLRYCLSVPIHLGPILRSTRESDAYRDHPVVRKWSAWSDQTAYYMSERLAFPILMTRSDDLRISYLAELQAEEVIGRSLAEVMGGRASPLEAARNAERRAADLLERLGITSTP